MTLTENPLFRVAQTEPYNMERELLLLHAEKEDEEKKKARQETGVAKIISPVSTPSQKTPDKNFAPERISDAYSTPQNTALNNKENNVDVEPKIVATFGQVVDIDKNKKAQLQERYGLWAIKHNITQTFDTLDFLKKLGLDSNTSLNERIDNLREDLKLLTTSMRKNNRRMESIKDLQKYIGVYSKTHKYFDEYRRTNCPQYYKKNETAIENCKLAKEFFDSLGIDNLPKIDDLKKEYGILQTENNRILAIQKRKQENLNELKKARKNLDIATSNSVSRPEKTSTKNKQKIEPENSRSTTHDSR